MMAAALVMTEEHQPNPHVTVLRDEVVAAMSAIQSGLIVDVTAGYGGHSEAILEALPGVSLIAFDRDPRAVAASRKRLERFGDRAQVVHSEFSQLRGWLRDNGISQVDGLVADLGVSSPQLDQAERGLSFRADGPLDMRMNPTSGETALELIQRLDQAELADLIYQLGDERRSRRIAACIKQDADAGKLHGTLDLRRSIIRAVGPARLNNIDPATRTFQALRIAVNSELDELASLMGGLHEIVRASGVVALISFHSLEDRLVKRGLQEKALWRKASSKPVLPTEAERMQNPRSRRAKLRVATRTALMTVPPRLPEGVDPWERRS
jgi:16S rRNA (cytosine1402-N4)-methyltransferase